jgi:riboflavin synthase
MFTGIVSDVGRIASVSQLPMGRRFRIETRYDPSDILIGASISCSGVCLTVVELSATSEPQAWFDVEAWEEALRLTTAGVWETGSLVNLERALKVGDELGGHLVSGHVDGQATIVAKKDEGEAIRFTLRAPRELARYIAQKGSVCLDGTSLTVNGVASDLFDVLLIRHSLQVTTWGEKREGDRVNLEVDQIARYAERLFSVGAVRPDERTGSGLE